MQLGDCRRGCLKTVCLFQWDHVPLHPKEVSWFVPVRLVIHPSFSHANHWRSCTIPQSLRQTPLYCRATWIIRVAMHESMVYGPFFRYEIVQEWISHDFPLESQMAGPIIFSHTYDMMGFSYPIAWWLVGDRYVLQLHPHCLKFFQQHHLKRPIPWRKGSSWKNSIGWWL